jgi:hypothetical protein
VAAQFRAFLAQIWRCRRCGLGGGTNGWKERETKLEGDEAGHPSENIFAVPRPQRHNDSFGGGVWNWLRGVNPMRFMQDRKKWRRHGKDTKRRGLF